MYIIYDAVLAWMNGIALWYLARTLYISLSLDQVVFVWVSSVCCAFGIAKFPNIIAWWFPSPPVANCLSTASIRCVVLTISSAIL